MQNAFQAQQNATSRRRLGLKVAGFARCPPGTIFSDRHA